MRRKRLFTAFMSTMLAAAMLSGYTVCASDRTDDPANNLEIDKNMSATLTYWGWDNHVTDALDPEFNKEYPNIKIEILPVASADYLPKLQQTIASGGELPDILVAEINYRYAATCMDIWENLEDAPYNFDRNDLYEFEQRLCSNSEGQIVGLETCLCPAGMAYKRNLTLEYLGTDDREELEQMLNSVDAIIEVGKQVKEKSDGKVYMFHSPSLVMEWLYFSSTTPLVNEDGSVNVTEKMTPIFEILCKFRDAGILNRYQNYTPQSDASYADNENIFYPCPNWAIDYNIKPNDPEGSGRWGLMMPAFGGYTAGGTIKGISKTCKNKEAAWAYLNWTYSQKGAEVARDEISYLIPKPSIVEQEGFASFEDPYFDNQDTFQFLYGDVVSEMQERELTPYDQIIFDTNTLMAQAVIGDDSLTAEQAVEKYREEVQNKIPDVEVK